MEETQLSFWKTLTHLWKVWEKNDSQVGGWICRENLEAFTINSTLQYKPHTAGVAYARKKVAES